MKSYYYFMISGFPKPFGYVHKDTVSKVNWPDFWTVNEEERKLVFHGGDTFEQRTKRMETTLRENRKKDKTSAFGRWSDERFPLYTDTGEHILDLDGSGVDAFGIVNYSCHLTAYVRTAQGVKYWVPTRSRTKMSFPGMLDNTVGGSLRSGESPLDCIVREAAEEASLPAAFTRANIKPCGTLSYTMTRTDDGQPGCQHQVQYIYEMELPEEKVLVPCDGEAESFTLMTLEEVREALGAGRFKDNCGMTWMAFLVRHGIVNAENEMHLIEICARLHRKHDLFIV
jgi:8-oxo-dGTP pyrophosphatase MutT (NUDIX family)